MVRQKKDNYDGGGVHLQPVISSGFFGVSGFTVTRFPSLFMNPRRLAVKPIINSPFSFLSRSRPPYARVRPTTRAVGRRVFFRTRSALIERALRAAFGLLYRGGGGGGRFTPLDEGIRAAGVRRTPRHGRLEKVLVRARIHRVG